MFCHTLHPCELSKQEAMMDGPLTERSLPYFLFWPTDYVSMTSRFVALISLLQPRPPITLELSFFFATFFLFFFLVNLNCSCELGRKISYFRAYRKADVAKHQELVSSLAKQEKGPHPLWQRCRPPGPRRLLLQLPSHSGTHFQTLGEKTEGRLPSGLLCLQA